MLTAGELILLPELKFWCSSLTLAGSVPFHKKKTSRSLLAFHFGKATHTETAVLRN